MTSVCDSGDSSSAVVNVRASSTILPADDDRTCGADLQRLEVGRVSVAVDRRREHDEQISRP